ncbi:MAG: GumC family protein, partial [Cyanobium sp.]
VFMLPAMYRSDSTVLIESQQVPESLVRSTITTYADERLQVIQQRVLTTSNVLGIIKKFKLYPKAQEQLGPTQLADMFRQAITVSRVNAEEGRRRGGAGLTIAFTLSFEDKDPRLARDVTNELLSLFLAENVRTRTERAEETTEFLRSEANRLQTEITQRESQIAAFKQTNRDALPELAQANSQALERLNASHREIRAAIEAARGKVGLVESQMALAKSAGGEPSGGGAVWELEQQLQKLLTRSTDKHPDVIAMRERIEEARTNAPPLGQEVVSPAMLQLRSQLDAARAEMAFLGEQRTAVERQITEVQERISRAPQVEQDYNNLLRDLANTRNPYPELRDKELEAKIAQNLEEGQMGERFSVIEPPNLPDEPFAPERARLMLIVVALAAGAGAGLAFLVELLQPVLWGQSLITAAMGSAPLISIPLIDAAPPPKVRYLFWPWVAAGLLAVVLVLGLVHVFVTPLDMLWYTIVNRLSRI